MNSLPSFIASYVVNSVWEVVLIAGVGWLMSRLLKKFGPQVEHIVWVFTLLLAVFTPAFPLFRWLLALLYVPREAGRYASVAFAVAQDGGEKLRGIYVLPAVVVVLLSCLCFLSVMYFLARLTWSLHRTTMLLRQAGPVSLTPEQDEIWRRCKQSFSLDTARILSSTRISGPVTLGLREPVLLVPVDFAAGCTAQDFLAALAHECAHMRRRDFQKNLLYEIAIVLVGFHPVTWILKAHIAQTREMICDRMATEQVIDPRSYTQSLLRLASMVAVTARVSTTHAIGIFDANILEKRIMMMQIKKQHLSGALKFGVMIPATLLLLSAAFGGAAMAVVIEAQSSSPTAAKAQPYGQTYRIGGEVSAPVLVFQKDADFPKSEIKLKVFDGNVVLSLVVDASGVPHNVHVVKSLKPDFDAQAVQAVRQYRFTPAKRSGEPVAVAMNIEVNFKKY
jgi:TonB family protein